jgi:hypothetical protein
VAGRLMAQPVYPQLRKHPLRAGTYASGQVATSPGGCLRQDEPQQQPTKLVSKRGARLGLGIGIILEQL